MVASYRKRRSQKTSNGKLIKRKAQDRHGREIVRKRLTLLFFGVILVLISFLPDLVSSLGNKKLTSIQSQAAEIPPDASFAHEPVKIDDKFTHNLRKKSAQLPIRIVIPSLNIDLAVKEARVIKGYWEVFPNNAGYGSGSGLPGETNNQVIFAHAREGLFLPLSKITKGQYVYVLTKDSWFRYSVSDIHEVTPEHIEVLAPTSEEVLTLYTCSGFADTKRLIVTAKRFK